MTYETRPLECWLRMNELRRKYFWHIWESNQRGDPLILGVGPAIALSSLPSGLGDCGVFGVGPYMARMMRHPRLAIQCHEATEARGFGRDVCASLRLSLGSYYLNFHNRAPNGQRVRPDFCLEFLVCEAQSKTIQWFAQVYNLPHFTLEMVPITPGHDEKVATLYLVRQMEEAIAWMEEVTGIKYDDSRLVEGVKNEWLTSALWARLCCLLKTRPAPLDMATLMSIMVTVMLTGKHRKETVNLLRMLLEEVEDRVRRGIAAAPLERCRLMHEGQPPYFFRPFFRYPQKFGAVFVGSRFLYSFFGAYEVKDGSWHPAITPLERGVEIGNREEALKTLAQLYLHYCPMIADIYLPNKIRNLVQVARDWGADAVVLHLDRGCRMITAGQMEARTELVKAGIPAMAYEGSNCDPRELSPSETLGRLDAFMESLGLCPVNP